MTSKESIKTRIVTIISRTQYVRRGGLTRLGAESANTDQFRQCLGISSHHHEEYPQRHKKSRDQLLKRIDLNKSATYSVVERTRREGNQYPQSSWRRCRNADSRASPQLSADNRGSRNFIMRPY
jgi:hypothetical protein